MTIKEYAKERNVSYEAVRQMIKRHSNELNGHIISQGNGRAKELDGEAVAMLDD